MSPSQRDSAEGCRLQNTPLLIGVDRLQSQVQCLCGHSLLQTELREVELSAEDGDAGGVPS